MTMEATLCSKCHMEMNFTLPMALVPNLEPSKFAHVFVLQYFN